MDGKSILFQFTDARSAQGAFDTLQELGYNPVLHEEEGEARKLHIHLDHSDLTSALEIAQAHGGRLIGEGNVSEGLYAQAYSLDRDNISIPAHVVNEDWPEWYAEAGSAIGLAADLADAGEDGGYGDPARLSAMNDIEAVAVTDPVSEETRKVEWGSDTEGFNSLSGDVHA